jgi:hypothetical protein
LAIFHVDVKVDGIRDDTVIAFIVVTICKERRQFVLEFALNLPFEDKNDQQKAKSGNKWLDSELFIWY